MVHKLREEERVIVLSCGERSVRFRPSLVIQRPRRRGGRSGPVARLEEPGTGSLSAGADLLVDALEAAGVEVVFGLPGVHNLALWRSLARSPIRLVTVRHEQAAAYAADGYARATGRCGVALTTTGPGAANTLGAVGEAWAGRSPIVVLATDIPSTLRREGVYRGVLHEMVDQGAMFAPLVKKVMKVHKAADAGDVLAAALVEALCPPSRPVYVEIPTDFLSADAPGGARGALSGRNPKGFVLPRAPAPEDVDAALALIGDSERPLIWAGGGAVASGAGDAVALLAERLVAPVLTTYQARGLLGTGHPCAVGVPPHVPAAGSLWDQADLVVAVGTDFDGMMTQNWRMPAPEHLIAVNVDAVDAAKSYPPDVMIVADADAGTRALADRLQPRAGHEGGTRRGGDGGRAGWRGTDELGERLARLRQRVRDDLVAEQPDAVRFLDEFDAAVPDDCVVVADMCIPGYWLAGFHRVSGPRRLAYPVGWGTLGFAFPAAIGAALGSSVPVVSVSGDGGFLFCCGELATVAQELVPLTAVIVDDGGYGMLRYDQRNAGDQQFGVDLLTPDYEALARSFGVDADTVDGLGKDFGEALADHVRRPTASVLVAKASLDPPPTTSPRWYRAV